MIFLVMVIAILVFVALWHFDVHKTLHVKFLSQNAGDAAAMAAARWQAITLNLVGDLNIVHAVAVMQELEGAGTDTDSEAIAGLQARLCYAGPMIAFAAAQQAGKNNRIHNNDEFTEYLQEHVDTIRVDYPEFIEEAYDGCLDEYADMLRLLCEEGIPVGPESMELYDDFLGAHVLLDKGFYDAVSSKSWCWFHFNAQALLDTYRDHNDWPPLPAIDNPRPINCEFFGLHLRKRMLYLGGSELLDLVNDIKQARGLSGGSVEEAVSEEAATWYCYGSRWYGRFAMSESWFPAAGDVKEQYDYAGADSGVRVVARPDMATPGLGAREITWTAAAKPFGYLGDNDKPAKYGIVLPAFRNVRLIPVDASSTPGGGGFDLEWRKHCEEHLQGYVDEGPRALDGSCWYCSQLRTWENEGFRQSGINWLSVNSDQCRIRGGGGGGGSGGTRRGH